MRIRRIVFSIRMEIVLLISIAMIPGCSLVNPHYRGKWEQKDASTYDTLQEAIKYANKGKRNYRKALSHQALLGSNLGLLLIPLGAASVGLGIAGGGTNTITALGLSGAATFGVATWLGSRSQQLVYAEGYKAINCAISVMEPLNFSTDEKRKFDNALVALSGAIENFENALNNHQLKLVG